MIPPTTPRNTFRPHEHLRRPVDFQRVYDRKRSAGDDFLLVFCDRNGLTHSRLGLSVSKKNGNAVIRNRIRRLMREAYRLEKHRLPPGLDIVLIPRNPRTFTLKKLRGSVVALVQRVERKLPPFEPPS